MKNLTLLILFFMVLTGCSSEGDRIIVPQANTVVPAPLLQLNEGRKWRADEETSASIYNMQEVMAHFVQAGDFSSETMYQDLGKVLQGELNSLYRNCTMTGPAHEELHKFLSPIGQDIKLLQETNLDVAAAAQMRLEERLLMYNTFFE